MLIDYISRCLQPCSFPKLFLAWSSILPLYQGQTIPDAFYSTESLPFAKVYSFVYWKTGSVQIFRESTNSKIRYAPGFLSPSIIALHLSVSLILSPIVSCSLTCLMNKKYLRPLRLVGSVFLSRFFLLSAPVAADQIFLGPFFETCITEAVFTSFARVHYLNIAVISRACALKRVCSSSWSGWTWAGLITFVEASRSGTLITSSRLSSSHSCIIEIVSLLVISFCCFRLSFSS